MSRKIFIRLTKKVSFLQILPVITPFHKRQELYLTVIPFFLSFLNDGSLTLLLLFKKSPFHPCSSPHPDTLQTAFTTFSISFPFLHLFHSTSQPLYLPMDIHCSTMLPAYSGMICSPFACPSTSDGPDGPSLSVGQPGILLFVSVTKLFLFRLPNR